jgi:DNA-binding LacI/PurR family transcriptional regulator
MRGAVRLFQSVAAPDAGRDVSRALMQLGHRRIAYIASGHGPGASAARFDGLVAGCREKPFEVPLLGRVETVFDNASVTPVTFTECDLRAALHAHASLSEVK